MGMYSIIIDENLSVDEKRLKEFKFPDGDGGHYDGEWLYGFLKEREEIKFYGYWTKSYMKYLDTLGKKGIVEGTCIVRYENTLIIMCKWDKSGFNYKFGHQPRFGEWQIKVKAHKRNGMVVKSHIRNRGAL